MKFIDGVRISEGELEDLLLDSLDGDTPKVFAAAYNDDIVGSIKVPNPKI
jgi:hypothetical protein